jgi:hypothetical protein
MAKRNTKVPREPASAAHATHPDLGITFREMGKLFTPGNLMASFMADGSVVPAPGRTMQEVAWAMSDVGRASEKYLARKVRSRGGKASAARRAAKAAPLDDKIKAEAARARAGSRRRLTDAEVAARVATELEIVVDRKRIRKKVDGKSR